MKTSAKSTIRIGVCLLLLAITCLGTACAVNPELPVTDSLSAEGSAAEGTLPASDSASVTDEPKPQKPPIHPSWESVFTQQGTVYNSVYRSFSAFNQLAEPFCVIPGLKQGFVPQGMDLWEEENLLLISGYFPQDSGIPTSMLFAVDAETGAFAAEYALYNSSGSRHTSHVGGVAVSDKNLYLSNSSKLYRIPLSDLKAAGTKGELQIREAISVPVRASFCNFSNGILWVGDFYIPNDSSYATPSWRHFTNRAGGSYGAWCVGYRLTDETENGFASTAWSAEAGYLLPDLILSIDQKVQGMTQLADGRIAVSQSYGRKNNSRLSIYPDLTVTEPHATVTLGGKSLPMWFLDAKAQPETLTALPMMQGLADRGDSFYILFESAAPIYQNDGGTYPTDRVWYAK